MLAADGHTWADICEHVSLGRVRGMSTRKGHIVLLDDVLDEAKRVMKDFLVRREKGQCVCVRKDQSDID